MRYWIAIIICVILVNGTLYLFRRKLEMQWYHYFYLNLGFVIGIMFKVIVFGWR